MKKYSAIGVMSGSSLDGLDIAMCEFYYDDGWNYSILDAHTYPFSEEWIINLREAPNIKSEKLIELDVEFGKLIGDHVNSFILENNFIPDLVCSHGHTVFHNPDKSYTLQIGDGQAIANITGIKTVYDFRKKDILLGGQGAPLVPIGDELLFHEYDYCLNIGGIANISYKKDDKRIAYDICPANQVLNHLSNQLGRKMDYNGNFAKLGKLNQSLLNCLNDHEYYRLSFPKSISNQLIKEHFIPVIDHFDASVEDKLYTVCKHIAYQINEAVKHLKGRILVTGGGAKNKFLIYAIKRETDCSIIVPEKSLIDFKEALIFAFMGVLKDIGEVNCLSSSTGASRDSSGGLITQ